MRIVDIFEVPKASDLACWALAEPSLIHAATVFRNFNDETHYW